MFIDYVALMLINMVAGHFILAFFVYKGIDEEDRKKWVPGFAMTGLIAFLTGLSMIWTWPLPGSYNSAYGEMSVFWGILFLGAALAMSQGWELFTVTIYGFFAGLAAIVLGIRIINLNMTLMPLLSGIGFILSGTGGVFSTPALYMRKNKIFRIMGVVVLVIAGLIWALTGYMGYWGHMEAFMKWQPK